MANFIEDLSPEKRILLAAALCIFISFLFSRRMPPPEPKTPPAVEETNQPHDQPVLNQAPEAEKEAGTAKLVAATTEIPASSTNVPLQPGKVPQLEETGVLRQSKPPLPSHQVVVDTDKARFLISTKGACLRSVRLKKYWEFDPPVQLLKAKVESALTVDLRDFWKARLEEVQKRAERIHREDYRRGKPVPEEAWVELVPQYEDNVAYPLVLRFSKGASDKDLVYECDTESLRVESGKTAELVLTAHTDAGLILRKTLRFSGDDPTFEVEVATEAPGGVGSLKGSLGDSWSLEWPDGIGHLPFQFHGTQDANLLYSLRNDSKEKSPTRRSWLVKQAQKVSSGEPPENFRYGLDGRVGWIVVETSYFIASFLPSQNPPMQGVYIAAKVLERPQFDTWVGMGVISRLSEKPRVVKVYVGPKVTSILKKVGGAMGLERVVYDSWFGKVCLLVEWLLNVFYAIIPSYGLAIILLCVLSKLLLYPLTYKQAQTQKKMAVLQPKIAELKEKYKDDSQKLSQEQMKLWKKHGVNPMGGCLPMVAQIPIFIALYRTIQSSIDLRGASFLWIHDLSLPDMTFFLPVSLPFLGNALNILPFFMMVISIVQMREQKKMMPDPSQGQMMMYMSIFFFFILYHFSSGLVLYWTTNSLTQWMQQKMMERLGHAAPKPGLTGKSEGDGADKKPPGSGMPNRLAKKKTQPVRKAKPRRRKAAR